ncbi:MAG: hypothetical protein Q7S14_03585 [bacterium]|nr:hypothetical protein [bacterium]
MDELKISIKSPEKEIFSGTAISVSSKNSTGKFDVLPGHANLITVIENNPIVIRQKNGTHQDFTFDLAIMYVASNQINIYTNINL